MRVFHTRLREIERTGKRSVIVGAVYTALDRLERTGLVTSSLGDPTKQRGGRAKRYFRVTPRGLKAARAGNAHASAIRRKSRRRPTGTSSISAGPPA